MFVTAFSLSPLCCTLLKKKTKKGNGEGRRKKEREKKGKICVRDETWKLSKIDLPKSEAFSGILMTANDRGKRYRHANKERRRIEEFQSKADLKTYYPLFVKEPCWPPHTHDYTHSNMSKFSRTEYMLLHKHGYLLAACTSRLIRLLGLPVFVSALSYIFFCFCDFVLFGFFKLFFRFCLHLSHSPSLLFYFEFYSSQPDERQLS